MKLSERTMQILRNYSLINPSLQFQEGDVLRTISPNKTVMAKAKLDGSIPSTFSIYELSRFLGVISLFEDPQFELDESKVDITSKGRKVSYTFADPSTIVTPPNRDLSVDDADVEFVLQQEDFAQVMKAMSVMSLPHFTVVGENGKIILRGTDTKNPSSDKYDIEVAETDLNFNAVFKIENMKILPSTYNVKISKKGIAQYSSDDVDYWISIESTSTFE
jgi:hypothetical protein